MNKSLSSRIEEANSTLIGDKNLDAVGNFFAKEYVAHVTGHDMKGGHDAVRGILEELFRAFPDLNVEVEVLLEGNDRVAWQRTLRGAQSGNFKGFPANDQEVIWRDMVTSQFRSGLICEEWVVTDLAEQLLRARKK